MLAALGWFLGVLILGIGYFTLSAFVHELGHWVSGRAMGATCTLGRHRSGPLALWITHIATAQPLSATQDLWITAAGGATQLAATAIVIASPGPPILHDVALISLPLTCLNAVPLPPADGYFALRALRRLRGDASAATRWAFGLQWAVLIAAVLAASACATSSVLASWREADAARAALGVLGVVIVLRVLHRLHRLHALDRSADSSTASAS